jgi:thiol-disulfide isomerase/thioredoxin
VIRSIAQVSWFVFLTVLLVGPAPFAAAADEYPVPDWKLRCADGSQVSLHESLAKGPVLVSFWALWCKPCLKELPHIDKLAQIHTGKLTVLAVNIDSQKSVSKVRPYLKSKGYKVTVPLDTSGDLSRQMQVGGTVPFLVLYDGTGKEVYRHLGYKEGDEKILAKHVEELLAGEEPTPEDAEVEPAPEAEAES